LRRECPRSDGAGTRRRQRGKQGNPIPGQGGAEAGVMTSKKKKRVDFSVRPRAAKESLPPDADQWVRGGPGADAVTPRQREETGPQKRLTLNLPAALH